MSTSPLLEAVFSLSDSAREALLAAFPAFPASPAASGSSRRPVDGAALARAAFEGRAGPKLSRALFFLGRFGTPRGRDALIEAAEAIGDPRAAEWFHLRPADVAAAVVVERATAKGRARATATRLAKLALLRLERELSERPTYELLATAPLSRSGALVHALRRALGPTLVDVWSHRDDDGAFRLALFTRLATTTRLTADKAGRLTARGGSSSEAEVAIDTLDVSPDGARAAFTTASRALLLRVAAALGLSLRPSFTLKPLHALDGAALAKIPLPPEVQSVAVVATRWRTPDGSRTETRARDVLTLRDREADGAGRTGYIDRATLRVTVGERTADAFLQLPHRVEISDPSCARSVRAALGALGLFDPGALPDDARSLAPFEHPDWRWRSVVGDAGFRALVEAKLLVRGTVAHVATKNASMLGASYVVRPVPGEDGAEYALGEDRAYGARLVTPRDREAWRLDLAALGASMRKDLGATAADGAAAIAIDGVLDLGTVALKSGKLRFVYAIGAPRKGWLGAVRRACGIGVTPVMLVPRGHAAGDGGVTAVELDVEEQLGARGIGRALGRAAEALDVVGEVELWRTCDEDVVIDAASQRVWVRKVLVLLSDGPYRLLEQLVRAAAVVNTKELGSKLSATGSPDDTARHARKRLASQVGAALRAAGISWDVTKLVVTEGKKGYRLGVSARIFG